MWDTSCPKGLGVVFVDMYCGTPAVWEDYVGVWGHLQWDTSCSEGLGGLWEHVLRD